MSLTDSPNRESSGPDLAGNGSSGNPSDPLLQAGSFIDASTTANVEALKPTKAETLQAHRLSDDTSFENSKNVPAPDSTDSPAEPRSQRKRTSVAAAVSSEKPDWLPPGWHFEDRVRTSGATAGTVDKYYFNTDKTRRFRSKKEVMSFLETGGRPSKRKKMSENGEADVAPSASQKQKKSSGVVKKAPVSFDFHNAPEKIKWVLADSADGAWTPFADEGKVPESTSKEWVAAFTSLTDKNARHIVF